MLTNPSCTAPRTSIGVLTRRVLTRRSVGSVIAARTLSAPARCMQDSTMASGVGAEEVFAGEGPGGEEFEQRAVAPGFHGHRRSAAPDAQRQSEHALRGHG